MFRKSKKKKKKVIIIYFKVENVTNMYNLTWSGQSKVTVTKFNLNIYKDNHELITTPVKPSSRKG